ncbi:hypothetical protein JHK85_033877 [Glycine max]|nr:hypothetical protein JHK85_033877 [Glycine max]
MLSPSTSSNVIPSLPLADLLGDILGSLAIESPPSSSVHSYSNSNMGLEGAAVLNPYQP